MNERHLFWQEYLIAFAQSELNNTLGQVSAYQENGFIRYIRHQIIGENEISIVLHFHLNKNGLEISLSTNPANLDLLGEGENAHQLTNAARDIAKMINPINSTDTYASLLFYRNGEVQLGANNQEAINEFLQVLDALLNG